jgi:uncharacterized protein YbjT (DUF2867 family)
MEVLILGATGLVGGTLLKEVLSDNVISKVTILVRRPLNIISEKLDQVIFNFDDLEKFASYFKVDCVFCCIGSTMKKSKTKEEFKKVDYEYILRSFNIANNSKVKKFLLVSSIGANEKSPFFYLRVKGQLEEDILYRSQISTVFVRPSLILGDRNESRPLEKLGQILYSKFNLLLNGNLKKYRASHVEEITTCLLNLSKNLSYDGPIEYMEDK